MCCFPLVTTRCVGVAWGGVGFCPFASKIHSVGLPFHPWRHAIFNLAREVIPLGPALDYHATLRWRLTLGTVGTSCFDMSCRAHPFFLLPSSFTDRDRSRLRRNRVRGTPEIIFDSFPFVRVSKHNLKAETDAARGDDFNVQADAPYDVEFPKVSASVDIYRGEFMATRRSDHTKQTGATTKT